MKRYSCIHSWNPHSQRCQSKVTTNVKLMTCGIKFAIKQILTSSVWWTHNQNDVDSQWYWPFFLSPSGITCKLFIMRDDFHFTTWHFFSLSKYTFLEQCYSGQNWPWFVIRNELSSPDNKLIKYINRPKQLVRYTKRMNHRFKYAWYLLISVPLPKYAHIELIIFW